MSEQINQEHAEQGPEENKGGTIQAHRILLGFCGLLLAAWLLSGFYQVKSDEVGIVECLGEFVSNAEGKAILVEQGLHYHLPWPISTVYKVSISQTRNMEVNAFNQSPDANSDVKLEQLRRGEPQALVNAKYDPYLITADKNVVHVEIAVTYRIDDPEAWLSTISHSADTADTLDEKRGAMFQQIAQHALTMRIAEMPVDDVFFQGRAELGAILTSALQDAMEISSAHGSTIKTPLDLGVHILQVSVVNVRAPDLVKAAFEDVGQARAEQLTAGERARSEANALKTQAEGNAAVLLQQADAYRQQVTDSAKGEASRFGQILEQYKRAPDVTRWNVFVDGLKSVTGNARRMVFASPGGKTWLPMDPEQFDAGQSTTRPGGG